LEVFEIFRGNAFVVFLNRALLMRKKLLFLKAKVKILSTYPPHLLAICQTHAGFQKTPLFLQRPSGGWAGSWQLAAGRWSLCQCQLCTRDKSR
jgi:hypothetical protein